MRFIFLFFFLSFPALSFAQSWDLNVPEEPLSISCETEYRIDGSTQVKVGSSYEYQVASATESGFSWAVEFSLKRNNETVELVSGKEKYLRYFTSPGKVVLHADVSETNGCKYTLEKEIRVYESMFVYVGVESHWLDSGVADLLDKNNILFEKYASDSKLPETGNSEKIWSAIEHGDVLIIWYKDTLWFFSDLVKFQKTRPIDFSKKRIYIISNFSKAFLSKVIAASLSKIGTTKAFLISEDQVYRLITSTSSKENNSSVGQELSYEKTQVVYSLGWLIEFLAYAWFSYQLISLLLAITFAILVLNFLKQVIGFNVFWIYYPILFAITILSLGFSGALVFLVIGLASILIVNAFSKWIHLLIHAKRSFLVWIYLVLLLLVLGLDNFLELSLINYAIFDNLLIVFPLLIAVVLAEKIFQEDIDIFEKAGIIDALQYGFITFVVYSILEQQTLRYLLISYPDIIIVIVLLNVLIGRYTGLQVFEYFRFLPLLRKLDEEEE